MSQLIFEQVRDFDPKAIFECGQCFRWVPESDGSYRGVAGGRQIRAAYAEQTLFLHGAAEEDRAFWRHYFDLDRDYEQIRARLSGKDRFLDRALAFGGGIRILNQEFFETLISFILSANNNIRRIQGCVEKTARFYGEERDGFYAFPDLDALRAAGEEELKERLHGGYRCRYLVRVCRQLQEDPVCLPALRSADREEARRRLCSYMGVGRKVADCILLFTGTRQDVFPVDVWVKRVMEQLYFGRPASAGEIDAFALSHFGGLCGFAQQYLFYCARSHWEELRNMI